MIHRREFLKGASALVTLPTFESLAPPLAATPVRAVWLYFPNGVAEGSWHPRRNRRTGKLEQLSEAMAPLERHREELLMFENLVTPRGNGHGAGTATWLTGGDWSGDEFDAGGVSVDQLAARAIGSKSVVPALTLSTRGEGFFAADLPRNSLSWSASDRPVFRETDPRAVFRRLFGEGPEADASVLDDLRGQARALRRRLGAGDQGKLDEYLESIRGVERRIAFAADETTRRRLEAARDLGLGAPPAALPADHGEYLDLLFDLIALALWSGATRLASLMLDHGQSNRYCTFVPGVKGTWHALSHWKDFDGRTEDDDGITSWKSPLSKRAMYDAVVTWHHERFARLLDRLASLPEGEGRLLDSTVIMYGSSIADGHEHKEQDLPILVAGGGGGAIRTGRQLRSRREVSLSRIHLATLKALGVPAEEFADSDEPADWS